MKIHLLNAKMQGTLALAVKFDLQALAAEASEYVVSFIRHSRGYMGGEPGVKSVSETRSFFQPQAAT